MALTKTTNDSAILIPPPGVSTNAAGTNDIRDIKAPVPIPNSWVWVAWAVAAAAALALAWWAWKRWRGKRPELKLAPVIPPHDRARRKLHEALKFLDQPKPFCTLVSDALRVYLEERFGLHAPERTTEEFLFELQAAAHLNFTQKQSLAEFLERCDLVKFARAEPTQTALMELHDAALRLVSETEPPPLTPTPGQESSSAPVATP